MQTSLEILEAKVRTQANAQPLGWMNIEVPQHIEPSGTVCVPKGAFEKWSVALQGGSHLATEWEPVCPSGLRTPGDNPYHSDWLLGSGLGLYSMEYSGRYPFFEEWEEAALFAKQTIQNRLLNFSSTVLLSGAWVRGCVISPQSPQQLDFSFLQYPPILVIAAASPEWLPAFLEVAAAGGAAIIERGGSVCHLISEARASTRMPVLRKRNARELYPEGTILDIDPAKGNISFTSTADCQVYSSNSEADLLKTNFW